MSAGGTVPVRAAGLRVERVLPVVLFALVLVVASMTVTPSPVGVFEDDAAYTVLGKALAEGDGYRFINLPGAPHATHFPPGYPALLAVLWRVFPTFPDNIVVFKFANAILLTLAALGTYRFGRGRLGFAPLTAAGVALAGTASVVVLKITGVVLSEPLFMAVMLPALLAAERTADSGDLRSAVWAGVLLGVLALIRTIGAVAIPAALLLLLLRRRPAAAVALAAGAALLLVPWQLWVSAYQHEIPPVLVGKYGSYGPWLAEGYREGGLPFAAQVLATNAARLRLALGFMLLPVEASWARGLAFFLLVGWLAAGLVSIVGRAPITAGFFVLYAAVIMVWPFQPDRFVLAVWPLLTLVFFAAALVLWRWRAPAGVLRIARSGALAAGCCLLIGHATYNVKGYTRQWWASGQQHFDRSAKPIVDWVAHHTAIGDVLSTEEDLLIYLYTGRRAIPVSPSLALEHVRPLSPEENLQWLEILLNEYRPRYYITEFRPAVRAADTLANRRPPVLRRAGNTTNAYVYEFIRR